MGMGEEFYGDDLSYNDGGYEDRSEPISISYEKIMYETEKAYLFNIDGDEVWLPKSQIDLDEVRDVIWVPQWLCEEEGLG